MSAHSGKHEQEDRKILEMNWITSTEKGEKAANVVEWNRGLRLREREREILDQRQPFEI